MSSAWYEQHHTATPSTFGGLRDSIGTGPPEALSVHESVHAALKAPAVPKLDAPLAPAVEALEEDSHSSSPAYVKECRTGIPPGGVSSVEIRGLRGVFHSVSPNRAEKRRNSPLKL